MLGLYTAAAILAVPMQIGMGCLFFHDDATLNTYGVLVNGALLAAGFNMMSLPPALALLAYHHNHTINKKLH